MSEIENLKKILLERYEFSPEGYVISKNTKRQLVFAKNHKGYLKARLFCPEVSKNADKRKPFFLHRLIAMFFLDDFNQNLQVNHKNGIRSDNRVENLEMVTNSQNVKHAWSYLDNDGERRKKLKKCAITGKFIKK